MTGLWTWTVKTADAATSGQIGVDQASWAAATVLNINKKTTDNVDQTTALAALVAGNTIDLQQKTDSTKFAHYVTGPGVDKGTWFQFPVTLAPLGCGGPLPAGNADVNVTATAAAAPKPITRILEMPLANGGTVAFNPDQVVRLAPAGPPGNYSIVWLADGTHYDLGCTYSDAMSEIQGTQPPKETEA